MSIVDKIKSDPSLLEELLKLDYKERPPTIQEFIENDIYLGRVTNNGKKVFPCWKETLSKIFSDNRIVEVVCTGAIGTGKCLKEDTLVSTNRGIETLRQIKNAHDSGDTTYVCTELGVEKVNDVFDTGKKKCKNVVTSAGDVIVGSFEHKFRVLEHDFNIVWKSMSQLKVGDFLVRHQNDNLLSNKCVDRDFAYFLGVLAGDGWLLYNKRKKPSGVGVIISSDDYEKEIEYTSTITNLISRYVNKPSEWKKYKKENAYSLKAHSVESVKKLKLYNADGYKDVPECILSSNSVGVVSFLSGLVDTDGYVSDSGISITSKSKVFAEKLQSVLISIGLRCHLQRKLVKTIVQYVKGNYTRRNVNKTYYTVHIINISSYLILNELGFRPLVSYKYSSFLKLCNKKVYGNNIRTVIPYSKPAMKRVAFHLKSCGTKIGSRKHKGLFAASNDNHRNKTVTLETIRRIYDIHKNAFELEPTFQYILKNNCYFTKVVSIFDSEENTLDLSIEKTHSYIVNGLVSHNSTVSNIGMAYILCRTLCMKDPFKFYDVMGVKSLTMAFFSMTKSLSDSSNFNAFQNLIKSSEWFLERGSLNKAENPILSFDIIDYKLGSPTSAGAGTIGTDVISACLDEINMPGMAKSVKEKTFNAYLGTLRRVESRFMRKGIIPGLKIFLCASKDTELSFLEIHVKRQLKMNPSGVYVKDVSLFEAKSENYCGTKFKVAVGDQYRKSEIVEDDTTEQFIKNGYRIIEIPTEHKTAFEYDIQSALRDIAGISVYSLSKYKFIPSEEHILKCYDSTLQNPVSRETIEMGLFDYDPLIGALDFSKIKFELKIPRYIHGDFGVSNDCFGLASSLLTGWKYEVVTQNGKTFKKRIPIITTEWVMRIKAKKDDRIPLEKITDFLIDIKTYGVNIAVYTYDLVLASESSIQTLTKAGIKCEYASMDRSPLAYNEFKNAIFNSSWRSIKHNKLHFEISNLIWDPEKQKVDHPEVVTSYKFMDDGTLEDISEEGSKDISDPVAASYYACLKASNSQIDLESFNDTMESFNLKDGILYELVDKNGNSKVTSDPTEIETLRKSGFSIKRKLMEDRYSSIKMYDDKGSEIIGIADPKSPGKFKKTTTIYDGILGVYGKK